MHDSILTHIVLLLLATIITVSIGRRLHFPTILNYILAGVLVGPYGFGWITNAEEVKFLAEFGVVFLLFSIGLEFSLSKMIAMRKQVFGLGSAQVFITGLLIFLFSMVFKLPTTEAIVLAGALTLSSTAIVIKQLTEQTEIQSRHGKATVGILIFQDIMAIPLLILIPALSHSNSGHLGQELLSSLFHGVIVAITMFLISRYILRPVFKEVASAKSSELFMLTVLTVVLGAALFTQQMGLSMTLGAFLAGMMLGETEYRYQIEADIRPFQDILLGLFFITVGMMISPKILVESPATLLLMTLSIILLKGTVITFIMILLKKNKGVALRTGLSLAQVGEFGLVLLTLALYVKILDPKLGQLVMTASVLSMMIAPFLIKFNGRIAKRLCIQSYGQDAAEIEREIKEASQHLKDHVVMCGFGRVGQIATKFLRKSSIPFIALDMDIKRVQEAKESGEPVYYGDSAKASILKSAHIKQAKIAIVTFTDFYATLKVIKTIHQVQPNLPILVRTEDDSHVDELIEAGATEVIPDIFESSIMLSSHLLLMVGVPASNVLRKTREVRTNRYRFLNDFYPGEMPETSKENHQIIGRIIQPITIEETAYAVGKKLGELNTQALNIEIEAIKRGSVRGDAPDHKTRLRSGDILVVAGQPDDIERFNSFINIGTL